MPISERILFTKYDIKELGYYTFPYIHEEEKTKPKEEQNATIDGVFVDSKQILDDFIDWVTSKNILEDTNTIPDPKEIIDENIPKKFRRRKANNKIYCLDYKKKSINNVEHYALVLWLESHTEDGKTNYLNKRSNSNDIHIVPEEAPGEDYIAGIPVYFLLIPSKKVAFTVGIKNHNLRANNEFEAYISNYLKLDAHYLQFSYDGEIIETVNYDFPGFPAPPNKAVRSSFKIDLSKRAINNIHGQQITKIIFENYQTLDLTESLNRESNEGFFFNDTGFTKVRTAIDVNLTVDQARELLDDWVRLNEDIRNDFKVKFQGDHKLYSWHNESMIQREFDVHLERAQGYYTAESLLNQVEIYYNEIEPML